MPPNTGQERRHTAIDHWRQPRPGCRGHIPPIFWLGDVNGNIPFPQYYYVLSDIADQYWLPSVRSASSRFHSAIRRHQFASVSSYTPPHSVVRPPNLELALTPLNPPIITPVTQNHGGDGQKSRHTPRITAPVYTWRS